MQEKRKGRLTAWLVEISERHGLAKRGKKGNRSKEDWEEKMLIRSRWWL